jgi:putative oxidoreductase
MKKFFAVRSYAVDVDAALLLVRLVMGLAFVFHGLGKIQTPMAWMGPDAPVPGFLQALAALSEFGGGLALILGLLTRLASLGLVFTMLVAVSLHMFIKGDPFVSTGGAAYEPAALYLVLAIFFLTAGPGRFSVDRKLFGLRS